MSRTPMSDLLRFGPVAPLLAEANDRGRRRFAAWDEGRFLGLVGNPLASLRRSLGEDGSPTLAAYLELAVEALGLGVLGHRIEDGGPVKRFGYANFLSFALLEYLPGHLSDIPESRRLDRLAAFWNAGEGLLDGPAWIDRYALAARGELGPPEALESFLRDLLAPAFSAGEPPDWSGPLRVSVLDLRRHRDEILPGPLRLAAPALLCVADRKGPGPWLGVLLRKNGRSLGLGPVPPPDDFEDDRPTPEVAPGPSRLTIGGRRVDLPHLGEPRELAVSPSGFVVATAADSQRLWIVEAS